MNTLALRFRTTMLWSLLLIWLSASPAFADRVELRDGSVINGTIVSAQDGVLKLHTSFAGTLSITQSEVSIFTTDEDVHVGWADGSEALGTVAANQAGIAVRAATGVQRGTTAQVSALWRPGTDSPAVRAARALAEQTERRWAYETSLAIAGRNGVSDKFGANVGVKAILASAHDKLVLTGAAERAEDNGVKSVDRRLGEVDYSSFVSPGNSPENGWYVRTSLEVDRIKALDLRSTSGLGFTRKLVKTTRQDFEFRVGLGYLHENYADSTRFSSAGLDLAFLHKYLIGDAKLSNTLTYTPAFEAFGNYRLLHESALEIPLSNAFWTLKLGMTNDYHNRPPDGVDSLDTTYFTSLILSWR